MTRHRHRAANVHEHDARKQEPAVYRFHKDWRVWVGVGVMLLAILTYVLTLDEAFLPSIMTK